MFVTQDRDDRDIICFIGDSYANCGSGIIDYGSQRSWGVRQLDADFLRHEVYTDLIADRLNMRPLVLGFGGASWWQTRDAVTKFFEQFPKEKKYVKKLVAVHTSSSRINSVYCDNASDLTVKSQLFLDPEFNDWCQRQWFREISREIFVDIPAIHFCCFEWPPGLRADDLVGIQFQDPLFHVTVGEYAGTEKQTKQLLDQGGVGVHHYCHLNEKNHRVMADILYENFINYDPAHKTLPLDRFDCPNRYGRYWPSDRYWALD